MPTRSLYGVCRILHERPCRYPWPAADSAASLARARFYEPQPAPPWPALHLCGAATGGRRPRTRPAPAPRRAARPPPRRGARGGRGGPALSRPGPVLSVRHRWEMSSGIDGNELLQCRNDFSRAEFLDPRARSAPGLFPWRHRLATPVTVPKLHSTPLCKPSPRTCTTVPPDSDPLGGSSPLTRGTTPIRHIGAPRRTHQSTAELCPGTCSRGSRARARSSVAHIFVGRGWPRPTKRTTLFLSLLALTPRRLPRP